MLNVIATPLHCGNGTSVTNISQQESINRIYKHRVAQSILNRSSRLTPIILSLFLPALLLMKKQQSNPSKKCIVPSEKRINGCRKISKN